MTFLYRAPLPRLAFLWRFRHVWGGGEFLWRNGSMSFDSNHEENLDVLQRGLGRCHTVTPDLMREAIARACPRLETLPAVAKAKLAALIETGAWTDAVLTLLKLELPQWTLRRLVYDDGEWHCRLSKQPALPLELDDGADAVHDVLALAILSALVEARRVGLVSRDARPSSVPVVRAPHGHVVCCDNFS
jgi:hypothetical protein